MVSEQRSGNMGGDSAMERGLDAARETTRKGSHSFLEKEESLKEMMDHDISELLLDWKKNSLAVKLFFLRGLVY